MYRAFRSVLIIAFTIIGGILGYQIAKWYVQLDTIRDLMRLQPQLLWASYAGFVAVGCLIALLSSSMAFSQLVKTADNLKEMPANDKIALVMGAGLGITFTLLLYPL